MNGMRFTIVDAAGTVSFVYDGAVLEPLLGACARGSRTLRDLLAAAEPRAPKLREFVESALAVFDEHNSATNLAAIHGAIVHFRPEEQPVFRVLDDLTREASLRSTTTGLIIFNLVQRRIIQLQNSYAEIYQMPLHVKQLQRAGWRIVP